MEMTIEQPKTYYVLRHPEDDQLFWSNTEGWVDTGGETRFTKEHRDRLDLSFDAVWVYGVSENHDKP